ncbi:hypothetical protein AB2B41_15575 [Marimonas sp. MJW-29]|uniref:Uncharacterized protein n=1 Tax=Sulfitobacter sediminis TaxID=3234186 RepID=A0ABV3RR41_9RHOB
METEQAVLLLGGLFAFIIIILLGRRPRRAKRCRWRKSMTGSRGSLIKYTCATCGSEAYRSNGKPDSCLAKLKTPGL